MAHKVGGSPSIMSQPFMMELEEQNSSPSNSSISDKVNSILENEGLERAKEYCASILQLGCQRSALDLYEASLWLAKLHMHTPTPQALQSARTVLKNARKLLKETKNLEKTSQKEAEILKYLAVISVHEKKFDEACALYEEGLKLYNHQKLAGDYIHLLQNQKDFKRALQICDRVLEVNPERIYFLYLRAKLLTILERWEESLEAYQSLLHKKKVTKSYQQEIVQDIILCCERTNDTALAIIYREQFCNLTSSATERIEQSRKLLADRLSRIRSTFSEMDLLKYPLSNSKMIDAIRAFPKEALEFFDSLPLKTYLAIAKIEASSPEHLQDARSILLKKPQNLPEPAAAVFHLWFARLCIQEGNFKEALEHCEESWKLAEKSTCPFLNHIVFTPPQDCKSALEFCELMLAKDFKSCGIFFYRAQLYASQAEWTKARLDSLTYLSYKSTKEAHRLEMHELAIKAAKELDDDEGAYEQMLNAFNEDTSLTLIDRIEMLNKCPKTWNDSVVAREEPNALFSRVLKVASNHLENGESQKAFLLFDYLLKHEKNLNSAELRQALLGRAKACICIGAQENFVSARQNLKEAFALLSKDDIKMKAEALECLALLDKAENKVNEARANFAKAWELNPSNNLRGSYARFLAEQKELEKALSLCEERGSVWPGIKMECYSIAHKCHDAIKTYNRTRNRHLPNDLHQGLLAYALKIFEKLGEYSEAKMCLLKICGLDETPKFILKMEKLLQLHKEEIVAAHLSELHKIDKPDIFYYTLVLQAYETELKTHPIHHVHFLKERAKLSQKQSGAELRKAIADYEKILEIMKAHLDTFTEAQRKEIERDLKAVRGDFQKKFKLHIQEILMRIQGYERAGLFLDAIQEYEEVIKLIDSQQGVQDRKQIEKRLAKAKGELPKQFKAQIAELKLKGQLYTVEENFAYAARDYAEALRIMRENPTIFEKNEQDEIEKCLAGPRAQLDRLVRPQVTQILTLAKRHENENNPTKAAQAYTDALKIMRANAIVFGPEEQQEVEDALKRTKDLREEKKE